MAYITISGIIVLLQYNHIIGGIYSHGYISDVSTRISGLTGGSWELPALLAMMVSASILDDYYRKRQILLLVIISIKRIIFK